MLVRSLPSESVYAVPTSIDAASVPAIAAKLSPIVGYPPDRLEAALRERTPFRWLKRKIPHDVAERVRALGIDGIGLKPEETGVRYAPSGRLASTVLGFVGTDENGLDGLEYALRRLPARRAGQDAHRSRRVRPRDPVRRSRRSSNARCRAGRSVLTLDSFVQFEAERLHRRVR